MKRLLWLAIYGLILQIAVCVLLVSPTWISRCINQERVLVKQTLGVQASDWIAKEAKQWYTKHFINRGWQQAVWHFFIPTEAERRASIGMENFALPWFNWVTTRLQVLFTMIFQCGYRLAQMKVWGSMIFVLLIPALLDGVLMRRIKKINFDYASPVIQHYSLQALGLLLLSQLIFWLSPIAVSPLITPVIIMICCVLLGLSISHLQKRI